MIHKTSKAISEAWREFLWLESAGGLLLVFSAVAALILVSGLCRWLVLHLSLPKTQADVQ